MPADEYESLELTKLIREQLPQLRAPEALRARVLEEISRAALVDDVRSSSSVPRRRALRTWLAAAALLIVVGGSYLAGSHWGLPLRDSTERDVLEAHFRALQSGHLTDVTSTDQHTVKPWFAGKLDFSPPVVRIEWAGFPLIGGRIDHLDKIPAAVLVYGKDKHLIDLFVYPDHGANVGMRLYSVNGIQVIVWRQNGMAYWAVSDLNEEDMKLFYTRVWVAALRP